MKDVEIFCLYRCPEWCTYARISFCQHAREAE